MPLRLLQLTAPKNVDLADVVDSRHLVAQWDDGRDEDRDEDRDPDENKEEGKEEGKGRGKGLRVYQLAVPADKTEALMDELEDRCGGRDGFRLLLLEIEAVLPRVEEKEEEEKEDKEEENRTEGEEAEGGPSAAENAGSAGSTETAGGTESGQAGSGKGDEEGEEDVGEKDAGEVDAGEDMEEGEASEAEEPESSHRISREELYADVTDGLAISPIFLSMTVFSTVVAAVGLLRDDLAVIIGAMVIAPLLRPNVALALATTLGDWKLAWRALVTNAAGVLLAVGLAAALGLMLPVNPEIPALHSRADLDLGSLLLALAAGAAGTLAFTQGLSGAVIGVMVAVALLPPVVAFGLLLGAGHFQLAFQAFLLTAGNIICINLAGVGTFLAQGIRPRYWWEARRAKKASLAAVGLWLLLLLALVGVLWISGNLEILTDPRASFG